MKAPEIKKYTAQTYLNLRSVDEKFYTFSADWAHPQTKRTCEKALDDAKEKVAAVGAEKTWGVKPDTPEFISTLSAFLGGVKLGDDPAQNAFTAYQVERYVNRLWYRGTKEEREALKNKLGHASDPAPAPAPSRRRRSKKADATDTTVKVKGKVTDKAAAPKAPKETNSGKVVLHEVEVNDPMAADMITYIGDFLREELTDEQKRSFVTGLCAAMKK